MSTKDTKSIMSLMETMDHEQVVFSYDKETGLKSIIAVHNTNLGPALGGTRMWDYASDEEAIIDVLRLSRGMSYKAAISGLKLGGGKAVIIGDAKTQKTDDLMKKFGEYVDRLGGSYITAEDVGMTTHDMKMVHESTKHVTGIPIEMGGAGDPSPFTAYGVYMGMKASAQYKWGSDSLKGKKVAVQGIGHVGENLVKHLTEEGAEVMINDIFMDRMQEISEKYGATIVEGDAIYEVEMDIYAPCALGATVNDTTIPKLKCEIIAGAANNQLADEVIHGEKLKELGIVYAPDFLINAGGLINVYSELHDMTKEDVMEKTKEIFNTTLEIFEKAEKENITTHKAAQVIAVDRIQNGL
ncbi:MAG: leucine dehydrogenase [Flavobacteriales bacterium]|jgi:leucine dehydrogenase|nr:leucine dehydrogenase [Flavobacteriales bacterium]